MRTTTLFLSLLFALATPALAGNASHQGEASTSNGSFAWNLKSFNVANDKQLQLGKTETLACGASKGCVLQIALDMNVEAQTDGSLIAFTQVDGKSIFPLNEYTVSCDANHFCVIPANQSEVVKKGSHKIAYYVLTGFNGTVESWNAHAQMY